MPTYLTPGVYLEEVGYSSGPKPVLRFPPAVEEVPGDRARPRWLPEHTHVAFIGFAERGPFRTPTWLHSWSDFTERFGQLVEGGALAYAVYGFFVNGGQSCVVIRVGPDAADALEIPEYELATVEDVSLVCAPDLMILHEQGKADLEAVRTAQLSLIAHCETSADRMVILDCPASLSPHEVKEWRTDLVGYDSSHAALYYPWIKVDDWYTGGTRFVPPSGHVAGVYARTDLLRGFHHTPANQTLEAVHSVEYLLSRYEQDILNPMGINTLVQSAGRGSLIWGSRTLSSDPNWRYIHRRRVLNFILRNIRKGTRWAIFERPDNRALRPRIAADIRDFLHLLWRSGALLGDTPDDAFTVTFDGGPFDEPRLVYIECAIALERDHTSHVRLVYFCD